jgi:prepilin peptidase CpaA
VDLVLIVILCSSLVIAAVQDLRFQKIPNIVTYPTMGIALVYHVMTNRLDGLVFSAGGLALGIALLIVPYVMGGMGAGDAKLMGASGAVLGPKGIFTAFLFTAVIGGIYALILVLMNPKICKGFITRHAATLKTFVMTRQFIPIPAAQDEKKPKLCYGVAIALGTLLYVFLDLLGYNFIYV